MNDTTTSLVVAAIGALSGLMPVAIALVVKWAEGRSDRIALMRAIEHSHKRLEFLNLWIRTQQLICSDKDFTKLTREFGEELAALRDDIQIHKSNGKESVLTREGERLIESRQKISKWRIAVLGYLPISAAGWVFHLLFYMAFGACVLLTGWVIYATFAYGNPGSTLWDWIILAYGPLVVAFVLAYVLFWIPARLISTARHKVKVDGRLSTNEGTDTNNA